MKTNFTKGQLEKEFNYICEMLLEEEKKECKNRFMYDDGNKLYQLRLLDGDEIEKLER